ncbi:MAG: hypothetical protein WCP26_03230 [Actinomycetes bacterium]
MSSPVAMLAVFAVCAAISLAASAVLIVRIERLGHRFGVTEAVLGLAAAVAADAPEITSAVTALVRGQRDVGVGVILGANVFQLAALLGLGAVVAGGIVLDRRVVAFEGAAALWIALVALAVVGGGVAPSLGLIAALLIFVPYVVVSSMSAERRARLPIPARWRGGVEEAIQEEVESMDAVEEAIEEATGDLRVKVGSRRDGLVAAIALLAVIAASAVLEWSASSLGKEWGIPDIVLGAIVIAGVTSVPNVVAAIYLARKGRGAATLSEAMNSNRINTLVGFLLPATLMGLVISAAGGAGLLAIWYVVMTAGVLGFAYLRKGISRIAGFGIIAVYVVVVITLIR